MVEVSSITEFGKVLIFLITGLVFVGLAFGLNKIIAPHHPNPEKNSSYECGEETTGNSWIQFNSRFYVIALILGMVNLYRNVNFLRDFTFRLGICLA